jgi:hypothetical protein
MTDTISGALPGLRAGSFTVRPAGPGIGFSTRNLLGATAAPLTDPGSGEDDTGYGYYDGPSGSIWRPGAGPGQRPAANPGGQAAGPRRLSSSLIVRAWHPRPGRGSAGPDKETP